MLFAYIQPAPPQVYQKPSVYDLSINQKDALFKYWLKHYLDKKRLPVTKPTRVDYQYIATYCKLLDDNIPIKRIDAALLSNLPRDKKLRTIIVSTLGVNIFCHYNVPKLFTKPLNDSAENKDNREHRGKGRRLA